MIAEFHPPGCQILTLWVGSDPTPPHSVSICRPDNETRQSTVLLQDLLCVALMMWMKKNKDPLKYAISYFPPLLGTVKNIFACALM